MEDKIDILNKKKECNVIKTYNYTYEADDPHKIVNTTEEIEKVIEQYKKQNPKTM